MLLEYLNILAEENQTLCDEMARLKNQNPNRTSIPPHCNLSIRRNRTPQPNVLVPISYLKPNH